MSSVLIACVCLLLSSFVSSAECTPLDDYVKKPDPSYEWQEILSPVRMDNYTVYYLNMTSQTWLSSDLVSCSVWWHVIAVTIPDKIQFSNTAFIYITGGNNHGDIPGVDNEEVMMSAMIGFSTGIVTASLFQVPNQPCVFSEDTLGKSRSEDAIIAFTWYHFMQDPSKPEYLLRLPMTKAVVRAMDTVAAFAKTKTSSVNITKFAIAGASKRGWTTWTTAAVVPERIIAMVPIVMDALNLQKNLHHMYRAYGGWTFAFDDYFEMNITGDIDNPNMALMCSIVDPYVYLSRLTMPKLLINAGGDEFFLPDDNYYFWDDLPRPKYFRMVPNVDHSLGNTVETILPGIRAYLLAVMMEYPLPIVSWTLYRTEKEGSIEIIADVAPTDITMIHANTIQAERRDFRLAIGPDPANPTPQSVFWSKSDPLKPVGTGAYSAKLQNPKEGWTAFFIQAKFPGPANSSFEFTTQVNIIPGTFPFAPCVGKGCLGKLV